MKIISIVISVLISIIGVNAQAMTNKASPYATWKPMNIGVPQECPMSLGNPKIYKQGWRVTQIMGAGGKLCKGSCNEVTDHRFVYHYARWNRDVTTVGQMNCNYLDRQSKERITISRNYIYRPTHTRETRYEVIHNHWPEGTENRVQITCNGMNPRACPFHQIN